MGPLSTFARVVHIVLVGWWMGAYAELVLLAGSVEAVVPSRHASGAVLLAALADLERASLWGLPILLVTLWVGWSGPGAKLRGRTTLAAVLGALVLLSRYVVRPRFRDVRDGLGRPVEDLGLTDPALADYLWWERILSASVLLEVAIALVLLVWAALRMRPKQSFGIEL